MKKKKLIYVTCQECGVVDNPRQIEKDLFEVGTATIMRCTDCGEPFAKLCRKCCPTNHQTLIYK